MGVAARSARGISSHVRESISSVEDTRGIPKSTVFVDLIAPWREKRRGARTMWVKS